MEIRDKQMIEVEDGSPRQIREGGLVRDDRRDRTNLGYCRLEADVGDWYGCGGQHGDDHYQHVRPRGRRVTGKVEQHPQTVLVKYSHW